MAKKIQNKRYLVNRAVYKAVKKYDHQQFENFCTDIYKSGWEDGKYLAKATMDEMKQIDKALAVSIGLGGNMKMSDYVREWAEAFKEPDPIEEKAMQILEKAKPVPIQIPEGFSDKERIKELEKDLIRAEAERDVFQKLYKEQLAIS